MTDQLNDNKTAEETLIELRKLVHELKWKLIDRGVDPNQPSSYHRSLSSPHISMLGQYQDAKAKLEEMEKNTKA